jgi:hypothetical protein
MNLRVSSEDEYFNSKDKPYGLSFGEWTVKWWRWIISVPIERNPALDNNGHNSGVNQTGPVWFLTGTFGENKMPTRNCIVPSDKACLFPVINYEINQLEDSSLDSDEAMINHVVQDINDIVKKEVIVDGKNFPAYRVQSSPEVFYLELEPSNCLGLMPGLIKVAADGYWAFLKPLNVGKHEIYFHGACSGGIRNSTARYLLNVVEQ